MIPQTSRPVVATLFRLQFLGQAREPSHSVNRP